LPAPPQYGPDAAYLQADATDRRFAASLAAGMKDEFASWQERASHIYAWLRARPTVRPAAIRIIPGTPYPEGTSPVTTTFDLSDADEVEFTLTGLDVKNAPVPLPDGFTAAWTLTDPDSTGAVLTPSADNTTAVLSAGVPDSNLMVSVSVTVTSPDGSTTVMQGAEAVIVTASDAVTVGIVPGTPAPEAPPAGP